MSILVEGTLLSPAGHVIGNADIVLTSISTSLVVLGGAPISIQTDAVGRYSFTLNNGNYAVSVSKDGNNWFSGMITVSDVTVPKSINALLLQDAMMAEIPADYWSYFQAQTGILFTSFSKIDEAVSTTTESKNITVAAKDIAVAARNDSEAFAGIAQSGSDAYTSREAAQAAINSGVEKRRYFPVKATGRTWSERYENINGIATPTGEKLSTSAAIDDAVAEMNSRTSNVPNELAGMPVNFLAGVQTTDNRIAPFMIDDGRLCYIDKNGKLQLAAADSDIMTRPYIEAEAFILPDGAVCTKVVVDPQGRVTEAWTEDGSYYFETPGGLKKVSGGGAAPAKNISYASSRGGVTGTTATRLSVDPDPSICYIIVSFGQSLAQGWNTLANDILIAKEPRYPDSCFMFKSPRGAGKENPNRGSTPITDLEPLRETINGGWKESAASSLASHVVYEIEQNTGHRIRTLSFIAATGGKPYMELTKGTFAWDTLVQGLIDARDVCLKNSWKPVVLCLDVMAGESDTDNVANMTTERYKRQIMQLDRNFNEEVHRIFNTAKNAIVALSQCAFTPGANIWNQPIRQAQYELDGIGNIRLAGPVYPQPSGDTIHINSLGQNRRGQMVARCVIWEYFGTGWRTLKFTNVAWKSDTSFLLIGDVPRPPLVLDTSNEIIKTDGLGAGLGFVFDDFSSNPPSITAVTVAGSNALQIDLSAAPASRNCRIGYAIKRNTGNNSQDGPLIGARGVVRDSTDHVSIYDGVSNPNWCPAFIMNI